MGLLIFASHRTAFRETSSGIPRVPAASRRSPPCVIRIRWSLRRFAWGVRRAPAPPTSRLECAMVNRHGLCGGVQKMALKLCRGNDVLSSMKLSIIKAHLVCKGLVWKIWQTQHHETQAAASSNHFPQSRPERRDWEGMTGARQGAFHMPSSSWKMIPSKAVQEEGAQG